MNKVIHLCFSTHSAPAAGLHMLYVCFRLLFWWCVKHERTGVTGDGFMLVSLFFFTPDSSYSREPNYSSINIQTHYTFDTHACTCRTQIHASEAFDVVPTSTRTFDSFRSFFFCALKMFVFPSVVHSYASSVILCVGGAAVVC